MHRTTRPTHAGDGGFALPELLVAVLVLALLAAVGIPSMTNHVARADDATVRSRLSDAALSLETCFPDTAEYASCVQRLAPAFGGNQRVAGAASGSHYVLAGRTPDGVVYVVARDGSGLIHTCAPTARNTGSCSGQAW